MWLADDNSNFRSDPKPRVDEFEKFELNSPPMEGGESLCEFYVEHSEQSEKMKSPFNLPSTLEENLKDVAGLGTRLQHELLHLPPEEKFPSKNLLSLFGQELLPANTFTQTFLQSILSSVDSRDPVVANAWMETLLDVIDLLPKEIIKGDILTLAVNKGQLSQPVSSRLLCCRLLGKICTKFDPYVIRKEILPVVLSLCQDVDFEVRGCMCRQLDIVAKGIGLEATKSSILPELVELANDEESCVRLAGIETVVLMLPMLDDETCIQAIIPLVKKLCENSIRSEDSTLPVISHQLGHLCHGLAINLTPEQKLWFLKFYRELAKLGLPHHKREITESEFSSAPMPDLVPQMDNQDRYRECRHACAYNFPAMALFSGPENFKKELYDIFAELCSDPFLSVRKTMASGFNEVTKLLGAHSPLILPELVHLLKDESLEVLKGLIPCLPESLKSVCSQDFLSGGNKDDQSQNIVQALIACEETASVTSNWRLHADFLRQLSCLPHCLSPEVIYATFVPLLFLKLHTARPIPCRVASAYSLLVFLKNTPRLEHRNGIINELIRELCYGRSCHKRMLFIRVCELVIELFSKAFFKQYFFKPLLELSEDSVPNIRLRLCAVLPQLKSLIKLPMDSSLLQQLESCVRRIMTDEKDRDVTAAVSKGIEELDKIEVATEPSSRRTSCIEPEIDLDDLRKEEEEKHLLDMEIKAKYDYENNHSRSPTTTRSLNRQGRIPVRKSFVCESRCIDWQNCKFIAVNISGGTLPKQSKARDAKTSTMTKVRSPPSQSTISSSKSMYPERRFSSPIACFETFRNRPVTLVSVSKANTDKAIALYTPSSYSVSKSSIPVCRSQSPSISRHFTKQSTLISKSPFERCPSPMPTSRNFLDQSQSCLSLLPSPDLNKSSWSTNLFHQSSLPNLSVAEQNTTGNSANSPVMPRNKFAQNISSKELMVSNNASKLKVKHRETPFPSPEVSRRSTSSSPSSGIGSRIPTPNVTLNRRKSMISNT